VEAKDRHKFLNLILESTALEMNQRTASAACPREVYPPEESGFGCRFVKS
jgi:hypothetical protein